LQSCGVQNNKYSTVLSNLFPIYNFRFLFLPFFFNMNRINIYSCLHVGWETKLLATIFYKNQRTKLSPQKSQSNQQPTTEIAWTISSTFSQRETLCVTYTLLFFFFFFFFLFLFPFFSSRGFFYFFKLIVNIFVFFFFFFVFFPFPFFSSKGFF